MELNRRRSFLINVAYWALTILLWVGALKLIPLFWPFLFGLALAYLFKHLSQPIVRLLHLRGRATVAIIALLFYSAVVLLFWTLAVLLAGQIVEVASWFPQFYRDHLLPAAESLGNRLTASLQLLVPSFALSVGELLDLLTKATGELVTSASGSLLSALSSRLTFLPVFLIGFVFMIVSSFTIGMDYKRVTSFLLRQIPQRFQTLALDIKSFLVSCLLKLLRAYLLIMTVTFCELSLGLWSLHVANFWKIAAITAALDILPLVGSGAVLITWGIYQLIIGNYPMGMGLLILWGVITTVRNIIEPRIVGDQLGLHPVATLTAMFLGLRLAGFPGLLAAPVLTLLLRYLNSTGRIQLYRT